VADGRRYLVSVSPRMLRDALTEVLASAGTDEVVAVEPGSSAPGRFDGAIIDAGMPQVRADVVIEIPDETGGSVVVHSSGPDVVIDLRERGAIRDVLDHLRRRV
jgi:hypothetical protein